MEWHFVACTYLFDSKQQAINKPQDNHVVVAQSRVAQSDCK